MHVDFPAVSDPSEWLEYETQRSSDLLNGLVHACSRSLYMQKLGKPPAF